MVTATLPAGRVRLEPRADLLSTSHGRSSSSNYLTGPGQCRLEPRYELDAIEGQSSLWSGEIKGPAVMITVR